MRHASVWFLAPVLALCSLVAACGDDGGDDGGDETSKAGSSPGGSGSGGAGSGVGGKSTSAGGKTSGSGTVTGSTRLPDIDTEAEAQDACDFAAERISEADVQAAVEGSCAVSGILAELVGGQSCEDARAACIADSGNPTSECSLEETSECDITLEEYVACVSAQAKQGADLLKDVTCESAITSLPLTPPAPPAACAAVYEACPELQPELPGTAE